MKPPGSFVPRASHGFPSQELPTLFAPKPLTLAESIIGRAG